MKMSEFYEKYWKVAGANGELIPLKLPDAERNIIDKAEEVNLPPYVRIWKRKEGWKYTVHPKVEQELS